MTQPNISLAAEAITHVGGVPVTNALITTWVVMALLIGVSVYMSGNLKKKPGRFQVIIELMVGGLYGFFETLASKESKKYLPIILTFFFFILIANWSGLLPGVGTVGFHEESGKFLPLFRGPTADLNTTLAFGLISFCLIQYAGFKASGISYFKKFINISNPINFFIGVLETVSDISKIISFAFRLFGNVFAGEVLLAVMASFLPVFLPIPFLGLEIFVGFIQALVFAMLTIVFINVAVSHGHEEAHAHE